MKTKCRKCGYKHTVAYAWGISKYFFCPVTKKLEWNGEGRPDVECEGVVPKLHKDIVSDVTDILIKCGGKKI